MGEQKAGDVGVGDRNMGSQRGWGCESMRQDQGEQEYETGTWRSRSLGML